MPTQAQKTSHAFCKWTLLLSFANQFVLLRRSKRTRNDAIWRLFKQMNWPKMLFLLLLCYSHAFVLNYQLNFWAVSLRMSILRIHIKGVFIIFHFTSSFI